MIRELRVGVARIEPISSGAYDRNPVTYAGSSRDAHVFDDTEQMEIRVSTSVIYKLKDFVQKKRDVQC